MKKLILLVTCYLLLVTPAYSQATDSATQVPDDLVQQNIKNRIDKVVEQKATASGEVLASKTLIKRGWVGTIADIAQTTLTLTTKPGTRQASFSDKTSFVESPKKTIKADDLAIGAHVIAIGFVNGNGVMDLRRLIVVTNFKPTPSREVQLVTLTEDKPEGLTAKTRITTGPDQKQATTKDLIPGAKAMLITVTGTLVRIHLL